MWYHRSSAPSGPLPKKDRASSTGHLLKPTLVITQSKTKRASRKTHFSISSIKTSKETTREPLESAAALLPLTEATPLLSDAAPIEVAPLSR